MLQIIADVAFFLVGAGIILYALFVATKSRRPPTELNFEKRGSLKQDFPALLVLVGLIAAGVGVFFRYQGYQNRSMA
jgi:hypothetical protein